VPHADFSLNICQIRSETWNEMFPLLKYPVVLFKYSIVLYSALQQTTLIIKRKEYPRRSNSASFVIATINYCYYCL